MKPIPAEEVYSIFRNWVIYDEELKTSHPHIFEKLKQEQEQQFKNYYEKGGKPIYFKWNKSRDYYLFLDKLDNSEYELQ
jgi:hypothetical protein